MTTDILNPAVLEMLTVFERVLKETGIDFYLVGAVARDIRLSGNSEYTPARKTKDVDIAVLIADQTEFYKAKDALIATGEFTAHPTEAIKLFTSNPLKWIYCRLGKLKTKFGRPDWKNPGYLPLMFPDLRKSYPMQRSLK